MMKKIIDYLLSNDLAEIPKRGRRELKSIIIDEKKIRYNTDKPISTVLTKKLLTVKKTNEYRNYALNKAKDAFSELEQAAARVCREAGARVTMHTRLSNLNIPAVQRFDDRTIEVIANGLPMWHGAQLAVDTTLVSPLTSDAQPRRRGGQYAGTALHTARRNKERTYPELVGAGRCRLVVLAIEVGGRWSTEATQFLRLLAQARARATPAPLRQATITTLIARWSALLTHASMHAFAASLLNTRDTNCNNGDGALPPLGHLLAQTPVGTATPSRLPGRWPHRFGLFWTLDFPLW